MNNLSNATFTNQSLKPTPALAIYILIPLFLVGLAFSIFILAVVHNPIFLLSILFLSVLVTAFVVYNSLVWRRNGAVLAYLHSLPDSDLNFAKHGDLVKITGLVSCGSVSLESSYEKVTRCVYTSTLLYEFGELGLKPADVNGPCFQWRLAYAERFSTDFNITDRKSGMRAVVKAGPGCNKVIPLILESKLVNTTRKCKSISTHLKKWLTERNLPGEARLLRLEEGYIKEGSYASVIGTLNINNDTTMIVEPPQLWTGCLWRKLLLPVDVDGLVLGVPEIDDTGTYPNSDQCLEHL